MVRRDAGSNSIDIVSYRPSVRFCHLLLGMFCNADNYPVFNLLSREDKYKFKAPAACACASEMRKAVENLAHGKYWYQKFPAAPRSMKELEMKGEKFTRKDS